MNLFDMLKAEKNIPVSDPIARLWGYLYQKKHGVSEISGVPPLRFMSRGGYLKDYRIYGNTVQNGTPTPGNPVEVQGCGERTENMFDISSSKGFVSSIGDWSQSIDGKRITVDCSRISGVARGLSMSLGTLSAGTYNFHIVWNIKPSTINICYVSGDTITTVTNADTTFSLPEDAEIELRIIAFKTLYTFEDIMLTSGSSAPSEYIPYGYKIPVTVSNGTNYITTPVYIGSEPLHKIDDYADYVDFKRGVVVRMIKKLVLDANERYSIPNITNPRIPIGFGISNILVSENVTLMYNSHFLINSSDENSIIMKDAYTSRKGNKSKIIWFFIPRVSFSDEISAENCISEFKAFLTAQYSAGTPVTVWYVLATPEEEPLENLLPVQTIKGSDILTVGTTVQPSNIWIRGKIKSID